MAGDRNIRNEPPWEFPPERDRCSRATFLDEQAEDIQERDNRIMCNKKRESPGFERLMTMQYKKGGQ